MANHGTCAVCQGTIRSPQQWTLTKMMNRVHNDRDDCIRVLRPWVIKRFLKANPNYEQEVARG